MIRRSTLLLCFITLSTLCNHIEQLQPPHCDAASVAVATSCDRPRRKAGINISVEHANDKTIVHCYGHGGSGYTTLFGSVDATLKLVRSERFDKQTPIDVIGSGCMGLTLAIELHRLGFTNITIYSKETYNLPSWRAGGWFDPGTGTETDPQDIFHLNLGLATYTTLRTIELNNHPYLTPQVVQRLPIYYPATISSGVEILETLALMPPSELVTLDFGNGAQHENYKKQMTYFIHVCDLMQQLWREVTRLNIPVVEQEVRAFAECSAPIICNCTGLGSATLNNDASLYPARGHFFMIKADAHDTPLNYMLFTKVGPNKEWIYWFPKTTFVNEHGESVACAGMLGGTNVAYGAMNDDELRTLDEQEFAKLSERTQQFFYGESVTA